MTSARQLAGQADKRMDEKRIVEAVDLKIHFPLEDNTVKAVDGISFHIDRGETLAVVGESWLWQVCDGHGADAAE